MASSEGTLFQEADNVVRELNEEELAKLLADVNLVSEFKQNKLEIEAQKNWEMFYKRNQTNFFKDRHWTRREFDEFSNNYGENGCTVLEVGCGVGNFMFPLLKENSNIVFYACDFSLRAIDYVKSHPSYDADRCTAFHCDITKDLLTDSVPEASVDIATLIFVLSAIHPDKMVQAVRNIAKTLKPDGVLLVRDYGLHDHAMLRFSKGHKLSDCFYVRQDGTRAYYFSLEKLNSIMEDSGLRTLKSNYVHRSTVNKKEGLNVSRVFVQGKFSKSVEKESCVSLATSS
uniref:tRNA N(3)-methylcytidine methyltransferase n=1 Tax=Arion vulgaris TaxID=1028688 RepID=A0A0B7B4E4_9EUPU